MYRVRVGNTWVVSVIQPVLRDIPLEGLYESDVDLDAQRLFNEYKVYKSQTPTYIPFIK